jgi:hypothetical protein
MTSKDSLFSQKINVKTNCSLFLTEIERSCTKIKTAFFSLICTRQKFFLALLWYQFLQIKHNGHGQGTKETQKSLNNVQHCERYIRACLYLTLLVNNLRILHIDVRIAEIVFLLSVWDPLRREDFILRGR